MAQITLISIYLPLILSLMPFPLIVPHENKFPSERKIICVRTKNNFLPNERFRVAAGWLGIFCLLCRVGIHPVSEPQART